MATTLQDLYGDLLAMCGIEISALGRLVVKTRAGDEEEEQEIPLKYAGKPIIFPEKQFINDPTNKDEGVITLHPLSESTLRGTSEVLDILRKAAIIRLCYVGDFLLKRAVAINNDATMDTGFKLNHKLSTLFSEVPAVDTKFVGWFDKLMEVTATDSSKRIFNVYFKREGEIGKNRYTRVCVISSPLYDELVMVGDGKEIFGVEAPRKKDIQTLIAIMEAIFPKLKTNEYMHGSSSPVAPTLIAFMETLALVGKSLNKTLETLGKEAKGISDGNTKGVDWDRNANLTHLRNVQPIEEFNIGVGQGEEEQQHGRETDIRKTPKATPKEVTITERSVKPEPTRTSPEPKEEATNTGFWNRRDSTETYVSQRVREEENRYGNNGRYDNGSQRYGNNESRYDNRDLDRGNRYGGNSGGSQRYGSNGGDRYDNRSNYGPQSYSNDNSSSGGFWNRNYR